MAKEEKSYYSQSLGTYNPKLRGRGHVPQIPTFKAMLIPVSVQTDWYTSHLPYQYPLQGGCLVDCQSLLLHLSHQVSSQV